MARRRGAVGALIVLGLTLVAGLSVIPVAEAVTGSPPVTQPDDAGAMYPGNAVIVTPLNNDSDPDGDELAICRLGTERHKGLHMGVDGPDVGISSSRKVVPGTYTLTYYACDFSYLTAGTISVTVKETPNIKVSKIAGRPGELRVKNPAPFAIRFLYGSFQEPEPDGQLVIPEDGSVVITVHRTKINWIAFNRRGDVFLRIGKVNNIRLRPGDHPTAAGKLPIPSGLARAWRAG